MSSEADTPIFRILGPVEVTAEEPVRFVRPQQRDLLGLLLLHANRLVRVDQIVEDMWGGAAPRTASTQLHNMISAIRAAVQSGLGEVSLEHDRAGYVLRVPPSQVDVSTFTDLVERGRSAADGGEAVGLLRRGLRLWRGTPLANVRAPYAVPARLALSEQRAVALEALFAMELRRGRHVEVVGELGECVQEYPFRDALIRLWITALYRAGRRPDALGAYRDAVHRLAEEHGLEPSQALRDLQLAVLRDDSVLGVDASGMEPGATGGTVRQLPNDLDGFVGREEGLADLDRLLEGNGDRSPTVVVSAVHGMAGVGKSALAVHWAHRVEKAFPDGQLYVNLRGYADDGPLPPDEVLRGFLEALAVPPDRIPSTLDGRAAAFRSVVADRRVLMVLDNARDAAQVRPLIPGSPGCAVVVTSRDPLTGLIASEGARPLSVDLMSHVEARALLAGRLGEERAAAEPDAVDSIVARCVGLPLALAIAGALAAADPHTSLTALAKLLGDVREGLAAFGGDDSRTDLRAVFSWSYDTLTVPAARLFRLLGLSTSTDISRTAVASLAGVPVSHVSGLLRELAKAQLITEHRPERYVLHDLVRAYARELVEAHDSEEERRQALRGMLDHFLHTAYTGALLLDPPRDAIVTGSPAEGATITELRTADEAYAWFLAERSSLLAAIEQAADHGQHTHVWQLAWTMSGFLQREGRWHELVHSQHRAVAAAERLGDRRAEAAAQRYLFIGYALLGQHDDARSHSRRALEAYTAAGDLKGQAYVQMDFGRAYQDDGDYDSALRHSAEALRLFRITQDRAGEARALNAIGWVHALRGEYRQTVEHCRRALPLHQQTGDVAGESATCDSLAYACHQLGSYATAVKWYRRSIDLVRQTGDRFYEAQSLDALGDVHRSAGQVGAARSVWDRAVAILDDLASPEADAVRAKLGSLGRVPPGGR